MSRLKLEAGDEVAIRAREDIKKGEVVCTIRRPFNAAVGEWCIDGKFIEDKIGRES